MRPAHGWPGETVILRIWLGRPNLPQDSTSRFQARSMWRPFVPIRWRLPCRRYGHSVSSSALHVHSARSWSRSGTGNICDIHSAILNLRRARIRAYLFNGARQNRIEQVITALPLFLHLSILLFCAGLVTFFLPSTGSLHIRLWQHIQSSERYTSSQSCH